MTEMTEEVYLENIATLRPALLRRAQSVVRDHAAAEDVVQDGILYCLQHLASFDEARASFKTWITRAVLGRALNAKRDTAYLYARGHNTIAEFNDQAEYDAHDPSMRAVHEAGLPQVRLVEPSAGDRRARMGEALSHEAHEVLIADRDAPFATKLAKRVSREAEANPGGVKASPIETVLDVRKALATLPPEQREAVEAVYMHGATDREFAAEQGVSRATMTRRLRQARCALQKILE